MSQGTAGDSQQSRCVRPCSATANQFGGDRHRMAMNIALPLTLPEASAQPTATVSRWQRPVVAHLGDD
jgi:hypothetical protein